MCTNSDFTNCLSYFEIIKKCIFFSNKMFLECKMSYLLTLPLYTGVSRVRALSPAWTGSPAWETLISRAISPQQKKFLPTLRAFPSLRSTFKIFCPWKKSSTIKSWPTFCDQYYWKFPIWNSRNNEKRREIRIIKVNVIFNYIRYWSVWHLYR